MSSSTMAVEKQGIAVAILGSDGGERVKSSLRRTLSADMSSRKWLEQNGFGLSRPIKKTASSKDLSLYPIADSFASDDGEESEAEREVGENHQREFDIWSSIVSQGKPAGVPFPPPYVHPLVKRTTGSLSEKSLQICTESLGSETGSDGFSNSNSNSDSDSDCCSDVDVGSATAARLVRKPAASSPAPATRCFPPPLPSLSSGAPALRMLSRRDNGRLVVEAVSVPATPQNFSAQRLDGRLVLKFAVTDRHVEEKPSTEEDLEELEEQFADESESDTEEEEEENKMIVEITESRLINFHRLALMANKPIGLPNRNYIKEADDDDGDDEDDDRKPLAMAKSLPPRPRGPVGRLILAPAAAMVSTTAAASFNHYDYFWRSKISTTADGFKTQTTTTAANDKREFVVSRGADGGHYLVPLLKACCKEPRRTLIWQPRCIATS